MQKVIGFVKTYNVSVVYLNPLTRRVKPWVTPTFDSTDMRTPKLDHSLESS